MLCLSFETLRLCHSPAYRHGPSCLFSLHQTVSIPTTVHMALDQFFVLGHKNLGTSVGALQPLTHTSKCTESLGDELPWGWRQAPGLFLLPAEESWGNLNP